MRYLLSSNQIKALFVRGQPLRIALPVPPHSIDDPVDWARSVLPEEVRNYVKSATEESIEVLPKVSTIDRNLTDLFGSIIGTQRDPRWFTLWVQAVVVTIEPPSIRNSPTALQWPLDVVIAGSHLIKDAEARRRLATGSGLESEPETGREA